MKSDFDYIKDIFDGDGVNAPESLSEGKLMDVLQKHAPEQVNEPGRVDELAARRAAAAGKNEQAARASRRSRIRRWTALAACLLLVVMAAPTAYNSIAGVPDTALVNGELYTFKSYGEIDRLVKSMNRQSASGFHLFSFGSGKGADYVEDSGEMIEYEAKNDQEMVSIADDAPVATAEEGSVAVGTAGNASPDHSSTYLQVEEVDEADIVKTDGEYIYYVNQKAEVVILSAKDGKTKKVATIGYEGVENYVHDIFLKGDLLVTVGVVYDNDNGYSAVVTYDISDRSAPKVLNEFRQTGHILSSRMVGNYVYLVTNEYLYGSGRNVPKCTVNGVYQEMPYSDICAVPQPTSSSYVILSSIDVASGKDADCKSKAVFGASSDIYCNDHNLYAVTSEYDRNSSTQFTRILRASLDGNNIKFDATGTVRGYTHNQFSMDEKDGYFRIATTSNRDGMDVNNLYILDGKLKETGKVTGFARNESIKAVRFIGDKAYVITYEQIDPLFIIDVSDPTAPRIEGEVEIEGFSSLLIPISEGRLLGIGYATSPNGYGGEYSDGLKLALFDISDPSEPKVLDSKEFKDMDSLVQYDHHALVINRKAGYLAFPYGKYIEEKISDGGIVVEDDGDIIQYVEGEASEETIATDDEPIEMPEPEYISKYTSGVLVFDAKDKIKVLDEHELTKDGEMFYRSVYIGDYIYSLDGDGTVYSFKFTK